MTGMAKAVFCWAIDFLTYLHLKICMAALIEKTIEITAKVVALKSNFLDK